MNRAAQSLGRLGGQSTSEAKRKASRANGKKGGRPKKIGIQGSGMTVDISKLTLEEILDLKDQLDRIRIRRPSNSKHSYAAGGWDWSKSNAEISRENRVQLPTVIYWRKKLGKPPGPREPHVSRAPNAKVQPRFNVDWAALDWNTPDMTIARSIGCTRELVRQKRLLLGRPKFHFADAKYKRFKEQLGDRNTLTLADRKEFGIASTTMASYCTRAGVALVRASMPSVHPWEKVNWVIPNNLLSRIWRIDRNNSLANHRCNHGLPKPQFCMRKGKYPPEFEAIVQAENEKADNHFTATPHQNERPAKAA